VLTRPFLTELDSRAHVKGSIDPLGAMAIWTRLGRRVVGNLTTVTTSVKDFKTVVVGFGLLADARRGAAHEAGTDDLGTFLRWEQLAAYTRFRAGDRRFPGIRRVRARLGARPIVPLSAERDCQILGNQKSYGLWGLLTAPSRASGLLEREANELTLAAEEFVGSVWKPRLSPVWRKLIDWVSRDNRRFNLERVASDLARIEEIWQRYLPGEQPFWRHHLVGGGPLDPTGGRQQRLASLLRRTLADEQFAFSQASVRHLAGQAKKTDRELSEDLFDIAACEAVLAPAAALFGYLLTQDRQRIERPVDAIRRRWPSRLAIDRDRFERLSPDLANASGSNRIAGLWQEVAGDFAEGRWARSLERLLQINRLVMEARGGGAWIVEEGGVLRVRIRSEETALPSADRLERLWWHPYFLSSLRTIVAELEAA
jgi:hypothetical protein